MGSYIMIGWLVQTPLYVPLTFEIGMTTGILSIVASNVGYKILSLFGSKNADSASNLYLYRAVKSIVKPIYSLDLLLNDPKYADGVQLLMWALLILGLVSYVNFKLYKTTLDNKEFLSESEMELNQATGDAKQLMQAHKDKVNPNKWKKEAERLLDERKTYVKKVEQVENLNKRYREAIFQIEKTYNEEHKLKKLEQKRLKNLTKFMEQCSTIVSNRKDKLDDTLKSAY